MYIKVECNRTGIDRLSGIKHRKYNHIEFIQTLTDGGNVLVDSHIMPMRYGAVYIFDTDKPHCTSPENPENYVRNCVTVEKPYFDQLIKATGADKILYEFSEYGVYHTLLSKSGIQRVENQFSLLASLVRSSAADADISLCLLELFVLLRDNSVSDSIPTDDAGHISIALDFINRNFSYGIGTKEVADHLHLSKHYLCHLFKQHTGMTLTEYLLDKRLSAANDLLDKQNISVRAVAEKLGFSSESYFIAKYKDRYGITPGKKR